MLKTLSTEPTKSRKDITGVGGKGRNRAEPVGKHEFDRSEIGDVEVNNNEVEDNEVGKKNQKTSKSKKFV